MGPAAARALIDESALAESINERASPIR